LLSLLVGHQENVASVSFSPAGNTVLSGAFDETVRIWDISSLGEGDAFQVACQRLGNNTGLFDVEARYGLSKLTPICGDHRPLAVDRAKLQ
jgi:WD40 repeat protein